MSLCLSLSEFLTLFGSAESITPAEMFKPKSNQLEWKCSHKLLLDISASAVTLWLKYILCRHSKSMLGNVWPLRFIKGACHVKKNKCEPCILFGNFGMQPHPNTNVKLIMV